MRHPPNVISPAVLENVPLWHERDGEQQTQEIPRCCCGRTSTHYRLNKRQIESHVHNPEHRDATQE